tara:strand:- start:218 stop:1018 length:801 start_codon:yes stop_codon:yes gene_type:complete
MRKLIKISILFYFLFLHLAFANETSDCEYLASVAEEKKDLPAGILSSISNVEAGRIVGSNPKRGWPWTVNHSGEGLFFENKLDAVKYVRSHLEIGDINMDVGCMQISLKWHSNQFSSLEEAFDPKLNINYAAVFLKKLFNDHGDWNLAIKHYHSADPNKNIKYHEKVLSAWGMEKNTNQLKPLQVIKANLTLPMLKPNLKILDKTKKLKVDQSLIKKNTNLKSENNTVIDNQDKNVVSSQRKSKNSSFIDERWDLVLKFRKEFKNY